MSRRDGNKSFNQRRNKVSHQRCRTTRGHRKISKFNKYKYYEDKLSEDIVNWLFANESSRR